MRPINIYIYSTNMKKNPWFLKKSLPSYDDNLIKEYATSINYPIYLQVRTERNVARIYKQGRERLGSFGGFNAKLIAKENIDFLKNALLLLKHSANDFGYNTASLYFGRGFEINVTADDSYSLKVGKGENIAFRIVRDTLQLEEGIPFSQTAIKKIRLFVQSVMHRCEGNKTKGCDLRLFMGGTIHRNYAARLCPKNNTKIVEKSS
jgi:hypothetical protein